jgi:hypothetical protein
MQNSAAAVWFGNEAWPSGASPGAFARDVFRIEKCRTDKERAFAFYKWFLRCMIRGNILPTVPGFGGMVRTSNPLHTFLWGSHECTGWGWVATEALQSAGMKARRSVINNAGHTFYEVWYTGDDGRAGWHAFDPYMGWYLLNEHDEVASLEEISANPDLVTRPRAGSSVRFGHHPERSTAQNYAFNCGDNIDVVQPVRNEETAYHPQVGQVYSNLWRPELPDLAWTDERSPAGLVCDIALYDEEGKPRYPEHLPYWSNYAWPAASRGGQVVRWHGCGALRWQPLQFGEAATLSSLNAVFDRGTVRPKGPNTHCEIWYRIQLPAIATYLRLNPNVEASGSDLLGFALSTDGGKTVESVHWANGAPPTLITYGTQPGKSVRGLREFDLRIDMSSKSSSSPLCIRQLGITVGYHCNMQVLPRLLPGDNPLYLQAGALNGVRLAAEWAYTQAGKETLESVVLDKPGRAARTVRAEVERPQDVIMRGVTLRCLPK